jgi:hypothetical protein
VPHISVAQFLPTLQALTESLDDAGYQLILGQSGYDHRREEALLQTMVGRRPDGIVVTGLVQSKSARERLRRLGIPVVENVGPERSADRHAGRLLASQGRQRRRRLLPRPRLAPPRHRDRRRSPCIAPPRRLRLDDRPRGADRGRARAEQHGAGARGARRAAARGSAARGGPAAAPTSSRKA